MASLLRHLTTGNIINIAIAVLVFAFTVPIAITELFAVNTSSWDAATVALFTIIPLVLVALFVQRFSPGKGS